MEINYLNNLKDYIKSQKRDLNKGFNEDKIHELEKLFNKKKPFPQAMRELLKMVGEKNNLGLIGNHSLFKLQKIVSQELFHSNLKIERPFFAFDYSDDEGYFFFIYLDEEKMDPDVYMANPHYISDKFPQFIKECGTLSTFINSDIDK